MLVMPGPRQSGPQLKTTLCGLKEWHTTDDEDEGVTVAITGSEEVSGCLSVSTAVIATR